MHPLHTPHDQASFGVYSAGVRAVAPVAAAVFVFGVTFGVVATQAGLSAEAALVFSLTTFAGSAQIAAASVLADGAWTAVLAATLLNLRYLPIGVSIAPALAGSIPKRMLVAQLAVDEAWAVSHLGGGRYDRHRLVGAGVAVLVAWVSGTLAGVLSGSIVGDPSRFGLDVLSPTLFLALLSGQLRARSHAAAALAGALVAASLLPFTPAGVPVVAAAAVAAFGLRRPCP